MNHAVAVLGGTICLKPRSIVVDVQAPFYSLDPEHLLVRAQSLRRPLYAAYERPPKHRASVSKHVMYMTG